MEARDGLIEWGEKENSKERTWKLYRKRLRIRIYGISPWPSFRTRIGAPWRTAGIPGHRNASFASTPGMGQPYCHLDSAEAGPAGSLPRLPSG